MNLSMLANAVLYVEGEEDDARKELWIGFDEKRKAHRQGEKRRRDAMRQDLLKFNQHLPPRNNDTNLPACINILQNGKHYVNALKKQNQDLESIKKSLREKNFKLTRRLRELKQDVALRDHEFTPRTKNAKKYEVIALSSDSESEELVSQNVGTNFLEAPCHEVTVSSENIQVQPESEWPPTTLLIPLPREVPKYIELKTPNRREMRPSRQRTVLDLTSETYTMFNLQSDEPLQSPEHPESAETEPAEPLNLSLPEKNNQPEKASCYSGGHIGPNHPCCSCSPLTEKQQPPPALAMITPMYLIQPAVILAVPQPSGMTSEGEFRWVPKCSSTNN